MIKISKQAAAIILGLVFCGPVAQAAVDHIEITERVPFAEGHIFGPTGAYEKLRGRAFFKLDPKSPANRAIVDLDLAPKDDKGLVNFSAEFVMLRPADPAKGNGTLIYDVNNRGGIAFLGQVNGRSPANNDPTTLADSGNGFIMKRGFSFLASAWTYDVEPGIGAQKPLILDPPIATKEGKVITGPVANEFIVTEKSDRARFVGIRAIAIPIADGKSKSAILTWRSAPNGKRTKIPRSQWDFAGTSDGTMPTDLVIAGGFETNKIYELVYEAKAPKVVGLGLAGIRDLISYVKHQDLAGQRPLPRAMIFGISQSGRVIQTMLIQGLHVDEAGQSSFDGAFIHVAGGGKGGFNHRFAMPTRHFSNLEDHIYLSDYFPFTTTPTTDPVIKRTASVLDRARAANAVPKLFYVNTSAEYWNRSASLPTTTPDGAADAAIDPLARVYLLAGGQHFVGRQRIRYPFANCVNTLDHYGAMRALVADLNDWMTSDKQPPQSRYPSLAAGSLVSAADYLKQFPAIPELALPIGNLEPPRLDYGKRFEAKGIADKMPPGWGAIFAAKVPAPDSDGLDRDGIRLPEMEVPLGTHLGWNTRAPETGFASYTDRFNGSFIPFARTEEERLARHDPRPSLAARYKDKADFTAKTAAAVDRAIAQGFLLDEERDEIIARRAKAYDRAMSHHPSDQTCDYSFAE